MYTSKRSQKSSHTSPHPFGGVGMHFSDAISVIITRPFLEGVAHSGMSTPQPVVAYPLVSVHLCQLIGELVNVTSQGLSSGVFDHSQAYLPTLPPYCTQHRGT